MSSFHDSFHGQAATLKNAKAAVCADCHTPHHNLPPSDPRSSVNPANLAKTCGTCHANASANFVKYDPHADKHSRARSPLLYYTAQFMSLLLVGVFSFGFTVLTGVVEEKQSRVVEVVLSTVRPRDLLMGKVLGIGLLALLQIVVLVGAGKMGLPLAAQFASHERAATHIAAIAREAIAMVAEKGTASITIEALKAERVFM